jgi:hypothetical protein
MAKYVFVTGGVTSSLGKGITAASIGRLLKRYSRPLLIAVGLIFGTIFLVEGLGGLGVL